MVVIYLFGFSFLFFSSSSLQRRGVLGFMVFLDFARIGIFRVLAFFVVFSVCMFSHCLPAGIFKIFLFSGVFLRKDSSEPNGFLFLLLLLGC